MTIYADDAKYRSLLAGIWANVPRITAGNLANKCAARMPQHGPTMGQPRKQHGGATYERQL